MDFPVDFIRHHRVGRGYSSGVLYIVDYDFYWAADEIAANSEIRYAFEIPGDFRDRTIYIRELK